jgi:hypothetical protein
LYLATIDNSQSLFYDLIKWIPIKEDNKKFISNKAGAMASILLAQLISIPGDLVSYILTKNINSYQIISIPNTDIPDTKLILRHDNQAQGLNFWGASSFFSLFFSLSSPSNQIIY